MIVRSVCVCVALIALTVARPTAVIAGEDEVPRTATATNVITAEQVIIFLDKDADSNVDLEEYSMAHPKVTPEVNATNFKRFDRNDDGLIDVGEAGLMAKYANQQRAAERGRGEPKSEGNSKGGGASGETTADQIVGVMDRDGDSKISKAEASEDLRLFFTRYDANKDGLIDLAEAKLAADYVNTMVHAGGVSDKGESPTTDKRYDANSAIALMDADRDGKINAEEAPDELKPHFTNFDANGDGAIDRREVSALLPYLNEAAGKSPDGKSQPGKLTAKQAIALMDVNQDGRVNADEATDELKPHFSWFDVNGDGAIDVDEVVTLLPYMNKAIADASEAKSPSGEDTSRQTITAQQIIAAMDRNGDGRIGTEEASEELKPNFRYIDSNGDGAIDAKEAEVMADYVNSIQG